MCMLVKARNLCVAVDDLQYGSHAICVLKLIADSALPTYL